MDPTNEPKYVALPICARCAQDFEEGIRLSSDARIQTCCLCGGQTSHRLTINCVEDTKGVNK